MILSGMIYLLILLLIAGVGFLLLIFGMIRLILVNKREQPATGKKRNARYIPPIILMLLSVLFVIPLITTVYDFSGQPSQRERNLAIIKENDPFYYAIWHEPDTVFDFLEDGYNPDEIINGRQYSYFASVCGAYDVNKEMAELLLDYGADVNLPSEIGMTPLMYAVDAVLVSSHYDDPFKSTQKCAEPYLEMVVFLLDNGAKVDYSYQDRSPISIAQNKRVIGNYDLEDIRQQLIILLNEHS